LGSASDENLEAWCDGTSKGPLRDLRTGTGFADAKLSEILPTARDARFVRMTKTELASLASVRMTKIALASLATVGMREETL